MDKGELGEGTRSEQFELGKKRFASALSQKNTKKRKTYNHLCIGHFAGGESRVGTSSKHSEETKRTKAINDEVYHEDAKHMLNSARSNAQSWQADAITELEDGLQTQDCDIKDQDVKMKKALSLPDVGEDVNDQVKHALQAEGQRAAKVLVREELDDHMAHEAVRVKRSSTATLGRPKLTKTELATQIGKIKRDRSQQIADVVEDLAKRIREMSTEVTATFGENRWPEDLTTAFNSMKEEHAERVTKIEVIKKKVDDASVEALLTKFGDQDKTVDAVKQQFIDDAKCVFKEFVPATTKSLGQFRQLLKKASTPKKPKKGEKGEPAEIPKIPIVKALMDVVDAGAPSYNITTLHDLAMYDGRKPATYALCASYVTDLKKVAGVTSHAKFLMKECEKHSVTTFMSGLKPAITKQLTSTLTKYLKEMMPNVPLKPCHDVIRASIFTPQCVVYAKNHVHVGLAPYGANEIRLLLDGQYIIAGVKFASVPGASFKEKVAYVMTPQGANDFATKAIQKEHGFLRLHDEPHTALHIPNGHILVTFGSHDPHDETGGASAIRWSGLPEHNRKPPLEQIVTEIEMYEATYDMSKTVYPVFKLCITDFLMPSATA